MSRLGSRQAFGRASALPFFSFSRKRTLKDIERHYGNLVVLQ
nr:MAG TPA: hypothetical protein [Caudoviricetes sp.]